MFFLRLIITCCNKKLQQLECIISFFVRASIEYIKNGTYFILMLLDIIIGLTTENNIIQGHVQ